MGGCRGRQGPEARDLAWATLASSGIGVRFVPNVGPALGAGLRGGGGVMPPQDIGSHPARDVLFPSLTESQLQRPTAVLRCPSTSQVEASEKSV